MVWMRRDLTHPRGDRARLLGTGAVLLTDAPGEIVRRYRGESLASLGTRFADANLSNSG
jgi:hypothetical protein